MKKTRTLWARAAMLLLLAVLGSIGAWADVVTIGTHDRSNSSLPCDQYSKYSLTQQIYTKDEINHAAGKITSIAFYGNDNGMERTCDIYLTATSKSSFASNTDWVTVAPEDKVFSGQITVTNGQWTIIDFDTPYDYDGNTNLLVTVDDNSNVANSSTVYWGVFDASGDQALYYSKRYSTPVNLDPTQPIEESGVYYARKNCIQLCFETYPKPYKLKAVEVGDVSAQIQCSLRSDETTGEAKAWNLRYRKVAGEGEEEQRWVAYNDLTDRSYTIEELTPHTKYEVQVQAIFAATEEGGDDNLSDWTNALVFTTACCPVEEQAEIMYAMNSGYSDWYGYAVQFIDITDEDNPVEVAYVNPPDYGLYSGTLTLCCGHKYKVNWIYDADHENVNHNFSLALYFEPGDKFYSMASGEAPEETSELTTFVMDCTPYCTQMPQNVSVAGTTFNSATLSFISQTTAGEVVYSTEANFNADTATPTSMNFTALPASDDPWGGTPDNASLTLTGLEPLTEYYVQVRSVCIDALTGEPEGVSRWSEPIKVTTGSRYDAPLQVIAEPVNSRTEQLSWGARGSEKAFNLYYRKQAAGTAVDASAIQTFGGGNGTGFDSGSWGEGIWSSYGNRPFSNTVYVADVPAGSSFGFKAGNGKTGAGKTKFLYGMKKLESGKTAEEQMKKFDKKCLNDADRLAIINALKDKKTELEAQLAALALKLANDEITQEQFNQQTEDINKEIEAVNEIIDELKTLPTDAQKLEQMRTLEQKIGNNVAAMAALALKYNNDEITKDEFTEQTAALEAQNALYGAELNELRAMTTNAENPQKDGFSITNDKQSSAQARGHKAAEAETYVFFIRHDDPNGVLLIQDLTITPPESQNEWTCIPNLTGTEYTLTWLEPATAYEVMVEPVYDDGTTGTPSVITVFTTIGKETDPVEGEFSVAEGKKVQFAHGNLRCEGERYEDEWSMAKQQYEVLGQDNIDDRGSRSYPAWLVDLLCWSTLDNYYGVSSYYYYDDEEAKSYFNGSFADWGECPAVIRDLGPGWRTLSKDEWNYLLNERPNAAQLKMLATIAIDDENKVKGLVLIPDDWTAPDGLLLSEEMTAAQWTAIEQTGVVFLPIAGQLTTTYENNNATTTVNEIGTYWTSTPSDDESGMKAFTLTINDTGITFDGDLSRRVATAVRLVKNVAVDLTLDEAVDNSQILADNNGKLANVTLTRTLKTGSWNTFAAPFAIDGATLTSMGIKAKKLTGSALTDEKLTMSFGNVVAIEAGLPYLVKVTADVVNPTFNGVTLSNATTPITTGYVDMQPTMGKALVVGPAGSEDDTQSVLFLGAANKMSHPTMVNTAGNDASYIKGFRAFFQLHNTANARVFVMDFGDEETTGIISIENGKLKIENEAGAWYDLQGRRISGQPTKKGVYVRRGNIVVIK